MNIPLMRERQRATKHKAYLRHKRKQQAFRNNLNLIQFSNRCGNHLNCIRISTSESRRHIRKKVEVCLNLLQQKHKFVTEAIFITGGRADVFDITEGVVYEILCSETEMRFTKKLQKYPESVEIVKVRC